MTTPAVIVPDARLPISDDGGLIAMVWQRFFVGLWQRTGGAQGPGAALTYGVSNDPTLAGASATALTTEAAVAGSFSARLARATLSGAVPAAGTSSSFAHGLASPPWHLSVWLVCVTAELGWGIGDTIQASGLNIWADATNAYVLVDALGVSVLDGGTGVLTAITPGNWTVELRAQI